MNKFIIAKMSRDAIPSGGGLADGIKFLTTPGAMSTGLRQATEWCDKAIQAVRSACAPNPWKTASEEEIAGELLRQIDLRKVSKKFRPEQADCPTPPAG